MLVEPNNENMIQPTCNFDRAMFFCYYYSFAFLADMLPYPLELF